MKSKYKKLGDYIEPCHEFNEGMQVKELLGINNIKYFQASHTNTIGIDLQTYRIVRKGQFAYNRATTRNGDKISISLREGSDCIVSPSYRVFKVKDENELSSEFLMMWFRRPEFDRYARFMSHGSAHEFFEWEQMCEVRLPVPNIDKQRELVKEYNTIVNRINLNNQLIQKLEETAQAIYKQWFVDFEFPDENGQPYRSSGGEMEWCEELGKEVPVGWEAIPFTKALKLSGGGTPSTEVAEYWNGQIPFYTPGDLTGNYFCIATSKKITEQGLKMCSSKLYPVNTIFVTARGATVGGITLAGIPMAMNQTCYAINSRNSNSYYSHQLSLLVISKLKNEAIGATFEALVTSNFDAELVTQPNQEIENKFELLVHSIYLNCLIKTNELSKLEDIKTIFLSKIAISN